MSYYRGHRQEYSLRSVRSCWTRSQMSTCSIAVVNLPCTWPLSSLLAMGMLFTHTSGKCRLEKGLSSPTMTPLVRCDLVQRAGDFSY
eukprot:6473312-Amphidinium_carterae.1